MQTALYEVGLAASSRAPLVHPPAPNMPCTSHPERDGSDSTTANSSPTPVPITTTIFRCSVSAVPT